MLIPMQKLNAGGQIQKIFKMKKNLEIKNKLREYVYTLN